MHEPVETAELVAFAKAVESRSLSRAAAELGVPRATLSRRLARLERRLGVRLLRRTTRSLTVTDAGQAFYRNARVALEAVARAEESVARGDDAVRGSLRVSVPPITDPSFLAMICGFAGRHPEVQLHLHFSSQYVDLQRDGYDAALRAGVVLEPGLIARTLARDALIAVAAPAYLAEHGTPKTAQDLRRHRLLLGFARGELPVTHWPLAGGGKLHVEGTLFSNDVTLLREAAVRGLGIAVLPLLVCARLLEDGKLVQVLPGVIQADSQVALVYPERELVPPQVRAFIAAVVEWAHELEGAPVPSKPARVRSGKRARTRSSRK